MRAVVALLALVAGCGATVRPAVPRFIARSLRTPVMAAALPSLKRGGPLAKLQQKKPLLAHLLQTAQILVYLTFLRLI